MPKVLREDKAVNQNTSIFIYLLWWKGLWDLLQQNKSWEEDRE